jgi:hypothetical protein
MKEIYFARTTKTCTSLKVEVIKVKQCVYYVIIHTRFMPLNDVSNNIALFVIIYSISRYIHVHVFFNR